MSLEDRDFVPVRTAFMIPRVMGVVVLLVFATGAITVGAAVSGFWVLIGLAIPLWVVLLGLGLFGAHVAFKKERYEVRQDHLVAHHGGLLSDGRTELDIRNITHVRLRLPWLRHKFFKIGDVRVESAGSAASEITFQSVREPLAVYEDVLQRMRANGFALEQDAVLHEESPTVLAAATDIVRTLFGLLISMVVLLSFSSAVIAGAADSGGALASLVVTLLVGGFVLFTLVSGIGGLFVRYMDLTRRTYTVYDDAVAYTEGFLTRDNAVIPYENIADASTTRTPLDQILGLYDVAISCQGSGSEIQFKRLARAPELREAVSNLVARAGDKSREAARKEAEAAEAADDTPDEIGKLGRKAPKKRVLVDPDAAWTAEIKMNLTRAMVPLLFTIPMFPLFVIGAIGTWIRVSRTTYSIGDNSMSSSYSFIGATQHQFAYDKVTGVQVNRSFIDSFMNTMTVQIWSIGAPMPLTLAHVSEDDVDLPALLAQCGIPHEAEAQGELKQSFGLKVWFIQNVPLFIALALVALMLLVAAITAEWAFLLVLPLLLLLPIPMAIATSMRVARQRVTFHAEHFEARTGILFKQHAHVRYDNVKKVETVAIPLTDQGIFKLYVAGERMVAAGNNQQVKMPYTVQATYIEGIASKVDTMDALLLGIIEPSQILQTHDQSDDVVAESKPAIANAVLPLAIIGLVFPPLWLLAGIAGWQAAVRRYYVETDRVVIRGGIVFKSVTSVLFERIDSLQQAQGALGKAFGNGRIIVLTAGSSMPDLVLADAADYTDLYDTIRKHYGKHTTS